MVLNNIYFVFCTFIFMSYLFVKKSDEIHTVDSLDSHTVTDKTSVDCSSEKVSFVYTFYILHSRN